MRNDFKQHEYGSIILPFVVLRRLDCVLAPTKEATLVAIKKMNVSPDLELTSPQFKLIAHTSKQSFYNTSKYDFSKLINDPNNLVENLNAYILGFSKNAREVFDYFKFGDRVSELSKQGLLYLLVQKYASMDLSPKAINTSAMGDIYEELIRKFSEMSNETAGEHFSPRDGLSLAVDILTAGREGDLTLPGRVVKVYDPCAGTGGALSIFANKVKGYNAEAIVETYGQEINPESYAICRSDIMLKGGDTSTIYLGNTLSQDGCKGEHFGYQISNPPYGVEWKKIKSAVTDEHDKLGFGGRFGAGLPRISDGQLLFVQHMVSKMRPKNEGGGRIAVFLNGSPLFSGAAGSGESEIRRWLLENDLVDAIIAMPNDFFYNTGIATYIWILDNNKPAFRKRKVQLINANGIFTKMRKCLGSKRNELIESQRDEILRLYVAFEENELSKIFDTTEFGYTTITVKRPGHDAQGGSVTDKKGKPKADTSLRDTENIPLGEDIEEYFKREVLPFVPDAWVEEKKSKVGYEIPFTRYFYKYKPLRASLDILAELKEIEKSIADKLTKADF